MNPLISIIVPIYNVEQYLPRCLDSILVQSFSNLEVILINDGSQDGSGMICEQYAGKDARIRVIHQNNSGVADARNVGLETYTGDYLMFVDSDDYISPNAVQVLFERILADDSDMVIGKHVDVYENGKIQGEFCSWFRNAVHTPQELFEIMGQTQRYGVASWAKLYRRSVLESIVYPNLRCGEDLWVFPHIVEQCNKISVVNETIYYYYQREGSIMRSKTEKAALDRMNAAIHMVDYLLKKGFHASAIKWLYYAIDRISWMKDIRYGTKLLEGHFDKTTRKELMKGQTPKVKLKWTLIHIPPVWRLWRRISMKLK